LSTKEKSPLSYKAERICRACSFGGAFRGDSGLVESGRTLKENGLVVLDTIADISARLVVNRVSMKMKSERINPIIDAIRKELEKR